MLVILMLQGPKVQRVGFIPPHTVFTPEENPWHVTEYEHLSVSPRERRISNLQSQPRLASSTFLTFTNSI